MGQQVVDVQMDLNPQHRLDFLAADGGQLVAEGRELVVLAVQRVAGKAIRQTGLNSCLVLQELEILKNWWVYIYFRFTKAY